jgi:hypothetical protein
MKQLTGLAEKTRFSTNVFSPSFRAIHLARSGAGVDGWRALAVTCRPYITYLEKES